MDTSSEQLSPASQEEWYARHVVVDANGAKRLCEATLDQSASRDRFNARSIRVTASSVKQILHRRPTTDPKKLVARLCYTSSFSNEATAYGRANGPKAVRVYSTLRSLFNSKEVCVEAAGLIVCPDFPWLGASPDGIFPLENELVEVKCPFVCRDTSFVDAEKTSTFC